MNHSVSVIYVNYNSSDLLINSIRSLEQNCNRVSFDVIIIDNASRPEERSTISNWLEERESSNIRLICSEQNLGFAKANNLGASYTNAKYLFFLNPDTLILNDVIEIFYDFLESAGPDSVACGGNLLHEDLSPNSSYGNFPNILLELCNVGLGLSTLLGAYYKKKIAISCTIHDDNSQSVPYLVGAAVFLRSKEFKALDGFDPGYFMYYEETDLFLRFNKLKLQSHVLPQAKIIHYEGASVGANNPGFNYNKFEMILNSRLYYYRKWLPGKISLIKSLILMQIAVQFLKGKWGSDFGRLLAIYRRSTSVPLDGKKHY